MPGTMRVRLAAVAACAGILAACAGPGNAGVAAPPPNLPPPDDIAAIGAAAYVYGLPYVEMAETRYQLLSLVPGIDSFFHRRGLATARSRVVTTPNNDTLYSIAWLDLACGPVLLATPDFGSHYWSVALMGMNSDVFAVPGTRTHGNRPGRFFVAGADWQGRVPAGAELIRSPSRWVWAMGRIGADDVPDVIRLQDNLQLTAPAGGCSASPGMPGRADAGDPEAYLDLLASLLAEDPPPAIDAPALAQFARIGLRPGQSFSIAGWNEAERAALKAGVAAAHDQVLHATGLGGRDVVNGWSFPPRDIANYGTDYGLRAAVALHGLAALPPAESLYATYVGDGTPLTGARRWRLHFAAGDLPPVDAFWSVTLYEPAGDGRFFFYANPENRYAVGSHTPGLTPNADGSLDILIQADEPKRLAANWLPAPAGAFSLTFRAYLPKPALLDGAWHIPPLTPAK